MNSHKSFIKHAGKILRNLLQDYKQLKYLCTFEQQAPIKLLETSSKDEVNVFNGDRSLCEALVVKL